MQTAQILLMLQATNAALEALSRTRRIAEDLVRAHNNDGHVTEDDKKAVNDEYDRLVRQSEDILDKGA